MKTMLIAFAFGAVMGAGLAYTNTADHYEDKARALREATAKAEQVRADAIHTLSSKYYAIYQDAVGREPATVVERVFVKANCPVRAASDAGMGDERNAAQVELTPEASRSVSEAEDWAERMYGECAAQLKFHQESRK